MSWAPPKPRLRLEPRVLPAAIRGWDAASLAAFDAAWRRGDPISRIALDFDIYASWVHAIRRRRGLPTRRDADGKWRGGNQYVRRLPGQEAGNPDA